MAKRTKRVEVEPEDDFSADLLYEMSKPKKRDYTIKRLKFASQKQKDFYDICFSEATKLVICDGPAGVGKTLLAMYAALKLVKQGKFSNILYVRSPVDSSEHGLGFLPGDLEEKTVNYMYPLHEKLCKFLSEEDVKGVFAEDLIIPTVHNFMRGRSINNTIVVVDEIQNFTIREAKTLFTRFEENTKIIACGDHQQSDIRMDSSLVKLMLMFGGEVEKEKAEENGVFTFEFDVDDVVRSGLTKYLLKVMNHHEKIARTERNRKSSGN